MGDHVGGAVTALEAFVGAVVPCPSPQRLAVINASGDVSC
jgi:hypothetical protein